MIKMNFAVKKEEKTFAGCNCLYNEKKMVEKSCHKKTPILGARYLY